MIHEIEPHRYDPEYRKRPAGDEDIALIYSGKAGIFTAYKDGNYCLPTIKDIRGFANEEMSEMEISELMDGCYFLFMIDNTGYYQIELPERMNNVVSFVKTTDEVPLPKDLYKGKYIYMSIHRFRELNPVSMVFAGATGFHIRNWKETVRYCGCCGAPTKPSETERAFVCTECGYTAYPQVAPAVIVAVTNKDKDKILLVRNLRRPKNVRLELVSGYVEVGESFEHAVHREVLEEVGLHVKNLRIYKDQPWGISGAHMVGYVAEVDGDDNVVRQEDEISEAKWYSRDEIPEYRNRLSVGSEMILKFKEGKL
ncbi:MAG: NAD(+) diphosphatase [Lachnospiraceae bacterium]|nr:NAD(+) diphosphatase [Lachnospiraceae bacterium]